MINADITAEIRRARFHGKSQEELKPLYIRRNSFDISLDSTIHRIFQIPFIFDDIETGRISLANIHPRVFNDDRENPLLGKVFVDEGGDSFTLDGIMKYYYGLSWTMEEKENLYWWPLYTDGNRGLESLPKPKK